MKVNKKYTAIQISSEFNNDEMNIKLSYGSAKVDYPKVVFDTEEEAIEWAYKRNRYGRWIICPQITFDDER
jgi:hypothetical protein